MPRGLVLFWQGDYHGSEPYLRSALERVPNDRLLLFYASIVITANRADQLQPFLQDRAEGFGEGVRQSVRFLIEAYKRDLNATQVDEMLSAVPRKERAGIVARAGLYAFDQFHFRRAKAFSHIAKSYGNAWDYRVYSLAALLAIHERRLDDAEKEIAEIDRRFSNVPDLILLRGLLARAKKRYEEAMAYLIECLRQRPAWAQPRHEAAWTAVAMGRHAEAEALIAGLTPNSRRRYEAKAILAASLFKRWKLLAGLRVMFSRGPDLNVPHS